MTDLNTLKRFRLCWSNPDGGTATLIEHPEGEFTFEDVSPAVTPAAPVTAPAAIIAKHKEAGNNG